MTPLAHPDVTRSTTPGVRLIGPIDESWGVDRQCLALGLAALSPDGKGVSGADAPPLLQAGPATVDAIRHSLTPPFRGFLETGPDGLARVGPDCAQTARAGGLVLSLTAGTVCALPIVEVTAIAIRRRLELADGENAELMEICLAEAVSNAVIHGNLEIPDHLRATPRGFDSFRRVMRERLDDPAMASRRVEIHALRDTESGMFTLTVSDEGPGFDLSGQLKKVNHIHAHSGRGLGLIRRACSRLESRNGGRTLVMTFMWADGTTN